MTRVLHVLSQRPMLTGSGVTLDALARCAARAGHEQAFVVGVPADDPPPALGGLDRDALAARYHPLTFGQGGRLDFPVPGMSDVMPYPSTRFSAMTADQLARYRDAWREHLATVVSAFEPELIHAHHVWLVGALLADVAPDVPVVTHCHATGLRQMSLCPHLADEVRAGCARNDRFVVLHRGHRDELARALGVDDDRIHVVGAGYRRDVFHAEGRDAGDGSSNVAYAGKFSHAKGLPWLLDAFAAAAAELAPRRVTLHVAGAGAGAEADALLDRMRQMPSVVVHGQLDPADLAALLRRTHTFVLPSFYEGLPLVLVEALACGNRLVATRLPGVEHEIVPHLVPPPASPSGVFATRPPIAALGLGRGTRPHSARPALLSAPWKTNDPLTDSGATTPGAWIEWVDPPRLHDVDRPDAADLPGFVDALRAALVRSLDQGPVGDAPGDALAAFTWDAVFERIAAVWHSLVAG